jgi:hypothetical protein
MNHHPEIDQPNSQDHQQPESKPRAQIRETSINSSESIKRFLTISTNKPTSRPMKILGRAAKRSQSSGYDLITQNVGTVKQVGDGVAIVSGLQGVMENELVLFPDGTYGLAMDLHEFHVGCVILGSCDHIQAGDIVYETGGLWMCR